MNQDQFNSKESARESGDSDSNYPRQSDRPHRFDALLALAGSGRDLWADEHADEYVDRLRESWE